MSDGNATSNSAATVLDGVIQEARCRAKKFREWVAEDTKERILPARREQLIGGAMALEAFADSLEDTE
jgi:hypothetical protein